MDAGAALSEIMLENVSFRLIEPHIYSIYSQAENVGSYDRFGSIYDVVACNRLYNRLVWGYSGRPVVLLDQSIKLLRMAKARLVSLHGSVPSNMVFLHGDALELPFKPKSFTTIISMNLLHCLDEVRKVLFGLKNVMADGATVSFSTLIKSGRLSDSYLNMLGNANALVPRTADQLLATFDGAGMPVQYRVSGNMAFIYCTAQNL
jgi:SAM-dependent methyltransferase